MNHVIVLALLAALPLLLEASPAYAAVAADDVCELRSADRARTGSRSCLGCHDGSVASGRLARPHGGSGSHPLDVDYLASHARRPGLRAPNVLSPALVLVDGKIACTTCHDPASSEHARTALPMRRSALCFACHDL